MRMTVRVLVVAALLFTPSRALAACADLARSVLPTTTVTSAVVVAAGTFKPSAGPAATAAVYARLPEFCRVAATLRPSADSDIKIEVWLPAAQWNGKFQAIGNGGWAGSIPYAQMAAALADGYATAGTDTGHTGGTAAFAVGHPEKVIDLGYRACTVISCTAR